MKRLAKFICISIILGSTFESVSASSKANLKWIGENEQKVNDQFTLQIAVENNTGSIVTIGGEIKIADTSCVKLIGADIINDSADYDNERFVFMNMHGKENDFSLINVNFETSNNACSTNITLENATLYFTDNEGIRNIEDSKEIVVKEEEEKVEEVIVEEKDLLEIPEIAEPVEAEEKVLKTSNYIKENKEEVVLQKNEIIVNDAKNENQETIDSIETIQNEEKTKVSFFEQIHSFLSQILKQFIK